MSYSILGYRFIIYFANRSGTLDGVGSVSPPPPTATNPCLHKNNIGLYNYTTADRPLVSCAIVAHKIIIRIGSLSINMSDMKLLNDIYDGLNAHFSSVACQLNQFWRPAIMVWWIMELNYWIHWHIFSWCIQDASVAFVGDYTLV